MLTTELGAQFSYSVQFLCLQNM